jgi:O-antigen/teichoic acid export membrane protein
MVSDKVGLIKKLFLRSVEYYQTNNRLRQVISLLSVNIIIIPLSIVSNIFITRLLGPSEFGDFKFVLNVVNLCMVIFTFGLYQAGNRAIVLNSDNEKNKEYYGSMLVISAILYFITAIAILVYALVDKNVHQKGLTTLLLFIIPFVWVFLLNKLYETLLQADNRIALLAQSRLYPKLMFFAAIVVLYFFFINYQWNKLRVILVLFLVTQIIIYIYLLKKIKPSLKNLKLRTTEIWNFNKTFGFNVYVGTLFNVAMASLSGLMISYFGINNSGVGYYSLALTIAEPLSFIPNVIATTHYKDFSERTSISKRLMMTTIAVTISILILCWLLVGPFIRVFYGSKFLPVINLTIIGSIGVLLGGFADFFNRFLGAHGRGKSLRNSAILVGVITMICNFTLIPSMNETGAALTQICSGLVYLLTMLWFYLKLVSKLNKEAPLEGTQS